MQIVIAIRNKAKDVIFLKNSSTILGRYFPFDLSHTKVALNTMSMSLLRKESLA